MMDAKKPSNGTVFGISVDKWISAIQAIGVPTALLGFICYMAWIYVPPIVAAHLKLLEDQRESLKSMDSTLTQNCETLRVIEKQQYPSQDFRERIYKDHDKAQESLNRIDSQVQEILKK